MADKTIGSLPQAQTVGDDSLFVCEQQGIAMKTTGAQWKGFASQAVNVYVGQAQQAAHQAQNAADLAKDAQDGAKSAQVEAEVAKNAIENMTVTAETLPPGSSATATKTTAGASFNILFGIPRGEQGDTGPQGAQGIQGPPGPQGTNGVAVAAEGQYAFNVDENGHLILYYTGDTPPDFEIKEDGHLYLNIA